MTHLKATALSSLFLVFPLIGRADEAQEVDKIFAPHFNAGTPGCSVVIESGGKSVFQRSYGSSRFASANEPEEKPVPMAPDTPLRLASVTKPILATAILRLRDQVRASGGSDLLDLRLGDLYPMLRKGPAEGVTIRQLLNHTSGLKDGYPDIPEYFPGTDSMLPFYLKIRGPSAFAHFSPGHRFIYANMGYHTLAAVLETISGMDWRRYVSEQIFEPLGMADSIIADGESQIALGKMAKGYSIVPGKGYVREIYGRWWRGIQGSGGAISSALDLTKFANAIREGRLLSQDSQRQTFTSVPLKPTEAYGLGWSTNALSLDKVGETTLYQRFHGGWDPEGSATYVGLTDRGTPACRLSVAITCNFGTGNPVDLAVPAKRIQEIYCP